MLVHLLYWVSTTLCLSPAQDPDAFNDYWYSGVAEINRYELKQARYGEIHQGDAVFIFVTEDFMTDTQVKHERGPRDNAVSVLKINATRTFNTGLYPYSLMTSVFTPVSQPSDCMKITTSVQEWCGHTYFQMNHRGSSFDISAHSYFQSEADQQIQVAAALTEDGIWNLVRLDPSALPTGLLRIFPGTQFMRLRHQPWRAQEAQGSLQQGADTWTYELSYPALQRTLTIEFERQFPHQIVAWSEQGPSGFGPQASIMKTEARLTHSIREAYWGMNRHRDRVARERLGLAVDSR